MTAFYPAANQKPLPPTLSQSRTHTHLRITTGGNFPFLETDQLIGECR